MIISKIIFWRFPFIITILTLFIIQCVFVLTSSAKDDTIKILYPGVETLKVVNNPYPVIRIRLEEAVGDDLVKQKNSQLYDKLLEYNLDFEHRKAIYEFDVTVKNNHNRNDLLNILNGLKINSI